jgi:hypothetical protein
VARQFYTWKNNLEDVQHTGWPRMVRTELKTQKDATVVNANCSQMANEVTAAAAAAAGISHGTCHNIV